MSHEMRTRQARRLQHMKQRQQTANAFVKTHRRLVRLAGSRRNHLDPPVIARSSIRTVQNAGFAPRALSHSSSSWKCTSTAIDRGL